MDMISAAAAVALLVGGAADGFVDTKYAFNADGTPRAILGMTPGLAGGLLLTGIGVAAKSPFLACLGIGAMVGEGMRYSANKTAASMAQLPPPQATAGVFGIAPQLAPANRNGGPVSEWEINAVFDRIEGLKQRAA